jgi:hypothetical protein
MTSPAPTFEGRLLPHPDEPPFANMQSLSLWTDMVFRDDDGARQLGTISGDLSALTVQLAVPVRAA